MFDLMLGVSELPYLDVLGRLVDCGLQTWGAVGIIAFPPCWISLVRVRRIMRAVYDRCNIHRASWTVWGFCLVIELCQ